MLWPGLCVAALVAAAAVPAASAKPSPAVKLSVLPLPIREINPVLSRSLPLQHASSGPLTDGGGDVMTPNRSLGSVGPVLSALGWQAGYALDYGRGASGGTGITEVRTSVDEYRTAADAEKGIAAYKTIDPQVTRWAGRGLKISVAWQCSAYGGVRNLMYVGSFSDSNLAPLNVVDQHLTVGRYVGDVTVWADTNAAAMKLVHKLAVKLDVRIKRALAGHLHETPVKLPPKQKPGPAPGGPDLSALALQSSDLGSSGTVTQFAHRYTVDGPASSPTALSAYWTNFIPAGQYDSLGQTIQWFATPNEASFQADFASSLFKPYRVPLQGIGDGSVAELVNGSSSSEARIVFLDGQLEEEIAFSSASTIKPSDVWRIAHKAAGYIDAAGLGT